MIGTRLRRLRTSKGLTQRELASPRYTHAYVSTIEAGRRQPSRAAVEFFAERLGVDPVELETGRPADLEGRLELRLHEARLALSAGSIEGSERTFRSIAKQAKRYEMGRLEALAEEGSGLLEERLGHPERALEHFERSQALIPAEVPSARADAVSGMARCFLALGDTRYAIHLLESLVDLLIRREFRDPDALSRLHASLVDAYIDAGLYERAARSAAELDLLAHRLTDPVRIAQMHMNVARHHLQEGRIVDAERSLLKAEEAYRQLGFKAELGGAHLARGYVLSRDGRLSEARGQLEQALAIFEETGDAKDLVRALNELARVERLQGNLERARDLLARSITTLGQSDAPILAWAHRELGLVLHGTEPSIAEKHLRTAIELYERAEQSVELAVTYRALGDLLEARGDGTAACEAYRTGILAVEPSR